MTHLEKAPPGIPENARFPPEEWTISKNGTEYHDHGGMRRRQKGNSENSTAADGELSEKGATTSPSGALTNETQEENANIESDTNLSEQDWIDRWNSSPNAMILVCSMNASDLLCPHPQDALVSKSATQL